VEGDAVGAGVAVASDGVGETGDTDGVDGGVGLCRIVAVDDGRAVGSGVPCPPPQAAAIRTTTASENTSHTTARHVLLISNLR